MNGYLCKDALEKTEGALKNGKSKYTDKMGTKSRTKKNKNNNNKQKQKQKKPEKPPRKYPKKNNTHTMSKHKKMSNSDSINIYTLFYAYLAFQSFDYQRTGWWLFQKCVVCTKLDFYVVFFYFLIF